MTMPQSCFLQFTDSVSRVMIVYYVNELSAASRARSQKLCKVMNIDENDIKVAARDLIRCF